MLKLLGADQSHEAVWNWINDLPEPLPDQPTAEPSQVVVDEKQIEVDDEKLARLSEVRL